MYINCTEYDKENLHVDSIEYDHIIKGYMHADLYNWIISF